MTVTLEDEHRFDCDEAAHWMKAFFDETWNRRLYVDTLGYRAWRLLEQNDDGTRLTRRVHLEPPLAGMPAPMQKMLGDAFSVVEAGTYDRTTQRYTFEFRPSVLADKVSMDGELWTQPADGGTLRRVRQRAEVKIPLLGGSMEKEILKDLQRSYAQGNTFMEQFLRELAAAEGGPRPGDL